MTANAVARVEPSAPSMVERAKSKELAPLTTERAKMLIMPMLPHGVTYERVLSEVYFAIQKNPELAECTAESLVTAVAQATKWDLEIGTLVHLVPFNVKVKVGDRDEWQKRAQAIRDYKGDATLVIRAGGARLIDPQAVYEGDHFEYELGTNPRIVHRPSSKRGKLTHFYAVAKLSRDDVRILVMTRDEVDEVRKKFSKSWKEHWVNKQKVEYTLEEIPWYGLKTVVHRICKLLPMTPKLAQVMAAFQTEDADVVESLDPRNAIDTPGIASGDAIDGTQHYRLTDRSFDAGEPESRSRPEAGSSANTQPLAGDPRASDDSDDLPFEDFPVTAGPTRQPLECELVKIPDGLGPRSGLTLGSLSNQDLDQLYRWAGKETGLRKYPDLKSQCEELLEMRRLGDAKEPQ